MDWPCVVCLLLCVACVGDAHVVKYGLCNPPALRPAFISPNLSRFSNHFNSSSLQTYAGEGLVKRDDYEQRLDDFMLRNRTIFLTGELDDNKAHRIIMLLMRMNEQDPISAVKFYINSPGGSVTSGMAIFDLFQSLEMPIETICLGQAASMGAFLLASGTKGRRCAMPNSRIMIHQPLGGAHGQASDIEIQANEILQTREMLNTHLAYFTGKTKDQIAQDCDRDNYMRPSEALEYGLIDRIINTKTSHLEIPNVMPLS